MVKTFLVDKMTYEDRKLYRRCWNNILNYKKRKGSHKTGIRENKKTINSIIRRYAKRPRFKKRRRFRKKSFKTLF